MADKLEQVAIRMVEQPPLYSNEPMNNPDVAIRVMNEFLSQMDRELFCIVNLQADLTPINMNIVSVGSLNEALINPREIFKSAILSNAHSMMLIHNHPSGNLTPSTSDIQTTARMQELGELMGISLVDHIITGRNGNYYSFRDKGEFPDSRVRFSTRVEDIDLTKGMVTEATAPYEEVTDTKEKGDVTNMHIFPIHEQYVKYLSVLRALYNSSMIKHRKISSVSFSKMEVNIVIFITIVNLFPDT